MKSGHRYTLQEAGAQCFCREAQIDQAARPAGLAGVGAVAGAGIAARFAARFTVANLDSQSRHSREREDKIHFAGLDRTGGRRR
jgi:hypothetical protein